MGVKRGLQPPKCRRGREASSTGVSRFILRKHVALDYQPKRIRHLPLNSLGVASQHDQVWVSGLLSKAIGGSIKMLIQFVRQSRHDD